MGGPFFNSFGCTRRQHILILERRAAGNLRVKLGLRVVFRFDLGWGGVGGKFCQGLKKKY